MHRYLISYIGCFLLLLAPTTATVASAANVDAARKSYFRADRLFKRKEWQMAKEEFLKALSLVKQLPNKTKRQQLFVNLGLSDIHYHLVRIDFIQKQRPSACRRLFSLLQQIEMIKKKWPRWRRERINLLLPGRFKKAKKMFGQCEDVPATVTLIELPPKASISIEAAGTDGAAPQWKSTPATFQTKARSVKIRIEAPGYLTQTRTLNVSRWVPQSFPFPLKAKPKPRVRPITRKRQVVVVRRRAKPKPPPIIPVYQKGWFWAVVGAGVVVVAGAGIAAGVYAANQGKITLKPPADPTNVFPKF